MTRPSLEALQAEKEYRRTHRIEFHYPDSGIVRRELYPKHLAFFAAGATHLERCLMAANRTGKTFAASYEVSCHLCGWYPEMVGRQKVREAR